MERKKIQKKKAIMLKGTVSQQYVTVLRKKKNIFGNVIYLVRRKSFLTGKFVIEYVSPELITFI